MQYSQPSNKKLPNNEGNLRIMKAIYVRTSPEDLVLELDAQLSSCRNYCKENGWDVYKEYIDLADVLDHKSRTAWWELHSDLRERKFDAIVMTKLDVAFSAVFDVFEFYRTIVSFGIAVKVVKFNAVFDFENRDVRQVMSSLWELEFESNSYVEEGLPREGSGERYIRSTRY